MADNEKEVTKGKRGRPPGRKTLHAKQRVRFTPNLKRKFIAFVSDGHSKTAAAALCGVHRQTYLHAARRDPSFQEAVDIATEKANAALETELYSRIRNGTETVEYDGEGNPTKTIKKKSDTLLLRALEAKNSDEWAKKGSSGANVNVNIDNGGNSAAQRLAQMLGVSLPEPETVDGEFEEIKDK